MELHLFFKICLWLGTLAVAVGTIGDQILTFKSNKQKSGEMATLLAGNENLQQGNQELKEQIKVYQEDLTKKDEQIKQLETQSKKSKLGIIEKHYTFNGQIREANAGVSSAEIGDTHFLYNKLIKLNEIKDFQNLLKMCNEQVNKTPEWFTLYFLKAIALANLGRPNEALENIEIVINNRGDDSEYKDAHDIKKQIMTALSKSVNDKGL